MVQQGITDRLRILVAADAAGVSAHIVQALRDAGCEVAIEPTADPSPATPQAAESAPDLVICRGLRPQRADAGGVDRPREDTAPGLDQNRLTLLAHALRSVGEGVCMTDDDDRIRFVNAAFCHIYGYTETELVGQPIQVLRGDEVPPDADQEIRAGTLQPGGWRGAIWNVRQDGTRILVSLATSTVRDEDGTPLALVGVIRDVTEARRTEDALRESEDRYRDLVESSADLICTHDLAGVFLTVNRASARAVGYQVTDLIGNSISEVLSPAGRRLFPSYLAEIAAAGSARGVMEVVTRSGEIRYWEYENSLRTEGVATPVVRGRARDVTDRLRAQHSLQESERRYRALFEAANDGVLLLRDNCFVDCNPRACELFGLSREQLLGKAPWELSPPHQPDNQPSEQRAVELIEAALGGTPQRFEWQHRRTDGSTLFVEVALSRLEIRGEWTLQALVRDITERHRVAESERRRLRQLAAVNRIARDVASELDPEAVVQAAVREIHEAFGYHNVILLLVDHEAGELSRQTIAGAYAEVAHLEYRQKVGEGLIGIAAASGRAVVSNDVASDPRYVVGFPVETATRAEAAVPVRLGAEVLAVLDVQEQHTGAFDESDLQMLETLASEIAVSLNNARLFAALKSSEERYRILAETAHDLIVVHDLTGRVLYANARAFEVTGYEPSELADLRVQDAIAPELRDAWSQRLRGRLDGDRSQHLYTLELEARDGRRIPVEISSTPLVEAGQTKAVLAVARDVSERLRAEHELRASEQRYRELFEANPHPMWVYDLATLRFLAVNDAAVAAYGWSRNEFLAMTLRDIHPPEDLARFEDRIATSLSAPQLESSAGWRHRTRDGRLLEVEITSHDLLFEGREARMVVAHDVTAHKATEAQLRQAQKMEAVGRLAGGVAHDFNNLLQAMLATVQVLRQPGESMPECGARLAELEDHVWRGASLTRQLLLFARREVSAHEALDLNHVIGDAVPMLRRLIRENIRMVIDLASEPLPIVGDRGQLEQVLVNLLVNAVDAMQAGGTLTLTSGREPTVVWWQVTDTGIGIPDDLQARLFEPFFTTKGIGKGTGLGLAVAHGIVTSHGGRIEIASVAGGGSTFRIVLPKGSDLADRIEQGAAGDVPAKGHRERVLVVEDEPTALAGLLDLLAMLDYDPSGVESAEAALELPSEAPFDILLTDYVLPGRNGLDLAASLRQRWPAVAVILMSGYAENAAVQGNALPAGFRYLQKPFGVAALARTLRTVADEREVT